MKKYFIIILILALVFLYHGCAWYSENVYYIDELELYIKMKKMRTIGRMYFSKDLEFGTDYVEFEKFFQGLGVYYQLPNMVYVINTDGEEIVSVHQCGFKITSIEKITVDALNRKYKGEPTLESYALPFTTFLSDSTFLKTPNYSFRVNDDATGFYAWDPEGVELNIVRIAD